MKAKSILSFDNIFYAILFILIFGSAILFFLIKGQNKIVIEKEFFYKYLRPVIISNCKLERLGRVHDGGYISCHLDIDYPEAAFSYGIGGRDSWGCNVANKYRIPVYQYDPFDLRRPPCNRRHKVYPSLIHFKPIGIAGETYTDPNGLKFETFTDSLKEVKVKNKVLVKMDIEGNEWLSLKKLLDDGSYQHISQLLLEIHQLFTYDINRANLIKSVLKQLYEKFYIVHLHSNNYSCDARMPGIPASVIEVTYVNRNLSRLKVKPNKIPEFPNKLDSPNDSNRADCPIDSTIFFRGIY